MNDTLEMMYYLCEVTSKKLKAMAEKFRQNHDEISNNEVALFNDLNHSMKSIKTTIAIMEAEPESGYSNNYSSHWSPSYSRYEGQSYRNRNSMGRYSRSNGLHDMIDNLPEDKMVQVQRYIEEMDRR